MKALDIEVYKNYFLAMGKDFETGEITYFEAWPGKPFDGKEAMQWLKADTSVTFNGNNFDLPIFGQACAGKSCAELKALCDKIILEEKRAWQLDIASPSCDHIDLIEPAPGVAVGLKVYGGRMSMPKMQDLPIAHDASITADQRALLRQYCENDLDTTIALYRTIEQQIELRRTMSKEYRLDLRSRSDAQIAEEVIKAQIMAATGLKISKPSVAPGTVFKYQPPSFINYQTEPLQQMLEAVRQMDFVIDDGGSPRCKPLESYKLKIGESTYRMGVGGLHSSEKQISHYQNDDYLLIDRDVASYYPAIILNCELYPKHIGPEFLTVYRGIVERRLEAKRAKNSVVADSLKITINGSFGKFGSKYSVLYSPDLLIQTTVTGQLSLLMLIESLELNGIQVVSANTDGIVIKCRRDKYETLNALIWQWEYFTGFETEETQYKALYSRDVNNYIAIKPDGSIKTKGAYAKTGLMKNPSTPVCIDAVSKYLAEGVPIESTILKCRDVVKFTSIRSVSGGGQFNGEPLGKVVRWYYSKTSNDCITYQKNGNKVAKTDGCRPMMTLTETIPPDINYDWYINESNSILEDLGATKCTAYKSTLNLELGLSSFKRCLFSGSKSENSLF